MLVCRACRGLLFVHDLRGCCSSLHFCVGFPVDLFDYFGWIVICCCCMVFDCLLAVPLVRLLSVLWLAYVLLLVMLVDLCYDELFCLLFVV